MPTLLCGGENHDCRGSGQAPPGRPRVSPRRRRFLATVAVLAAATLVGLALVLRSAHDGAAPVAQNRLGPVLLVPGFGGSATALDRLARVLREGGRDARVVRLPGSGTGPLEEQAAVLASAADAALATGAPSVDVVGFSAGGVVARLWVAEDGGAGKARRVVTLGSPHHGSQIAALASVLAPGSCPPACQELAPDSPLLGRLNRGDETPSGPLWVSIRTTDDQVVTPSASADLDGALNVVVQDVCPGRQVAHGQLPTDAAVQSLVLDALRVRTPVAPTSCPG